MQLKRMETWFFHFHSFNPPILNLEAVHRLRERERERESNFHFEQLNRGGKVKKTGHELQASNLS